MDLLNQSPKIKPIRRKRVKIFMINFSPMRNAEGTVLSLLYM